MKVLIAGDFCQKHRIDDIFKASKYEDLFKDIKPIINQTDYKIVNFEFPIVADTMSAKPIKKCGPNLMGSIEAVEAVKCAGFDCCTLANNHILDQGEECCANTQSELQKAGIDTVGAGRNIKEAEGILYKKIQGETLAVINCCEHEFSIASEKSAGANPLNPIRQYYKIKEARNHADYVLIIVHGGHEHFNLPSPRMQETYRFFIEAGADAVVNHHQHCFSGYEEYEGKPIFYGLGNFLFDNPSKRYNAWNYGYMVEIDFSKTRIAYKLHPYTQCNDNPCVTSLNQEKELEFSNTIEKINNIIADKIELNKQIEQYHSKSRLAELATLEPYSGSVLFYLFIKGFLPRIINKKKAITILNHLECESHRDKLIGALKLFINNN